jgi:hypothetical protein
VLNRTRQRGGLLATLFAVVAIVSGLVVGVGGYLAEAEATGVSAALAESAGPEAGFVFILEPAADTVEQDAAVRALLARAFRDGGRDIPLTIDRSVVVDKPVPFSAADSSSDRVIVQGISGLPERATLVDGAWPTSPTEVTVQADAAQLLNLTVGVPLTVGDAEAVVSGTWRADDRFDQRWLGDPYATGGTDGQYAGPIVVDDALWDAIGVEHLVHWSITPIGEKLTVPDLGALGTAWRGIGTMADSQSNLDASTLETGGQLARTLSDVRTSIAALHSVQPVALLVVAAIALVALLELARLLAGVRAAEHLLLWSRGASVAGLTAFAAVEAAIVGIAGGVVGAAVASGMLQLALARDPVVSDLLLAPIIAAIATAIAFGATTFTAVRVFGNRGASNTAGRLATRSGLGGVVILAIAAGLSTWQLLLYGSPLIASRGGGQQVDPLAVSAPVLLLASLSLLGLLIVPLLARPVDRHARRTPRLAMVGRTLTRRLRMTTTPIIVCALAFGQVLVAASYSESWDRTDTVSHDLRVGAAVRIDKGGVTIDAATTAEAVANPGVDFAAPVMLSTTSLGTSSVELISVSREALRRIGADLPGPDSGISLADAIAPAEPATQDDPMQLGASAQELSITVEATGFQQPPSVIAILTDTLGVQVRAPLDPSATGSFAGDVPPLPNGDDTHWRVSGFEVSVPRGTVGDDEAATFSLTGLSVDSSGPMLTADAWTTVEAGERATYFEPLPNGKGFSLLGFGVARILPPAADAVLSPSVVISATVAERTGLQPGDRVTVAVDHRWDPLPAIVGAVVPVIPGSIGDDAVLLDVAVIQSILLQVDPLSAMPDALWLGAAAPEETASELRHELPAALRIQAAGPDARHDMLQSASTSLWLGALGAALLAVLAVAAVARANLDSRRGELVVLRTLGVPVARLAALRRSELSIAVGAGALVGAVAGAVVTILTVPALVHGAAPGSYSALPSMIGVSVLPLVVVSGIFGATLALIIAVYGARVRRQATRLSAREVEE